LRRFLGGNDLAEKLSRKELRAPDAFQRAGGEVRDWLEANLKPVITVVALVLLGFLGVGLARYLGSRGDEQAAKELGTALKVLDRTVETAAPNFDQAAASKEPAFKSEKEKDEAVVKALSEFRSKYKSNKASVTAALPLAQAYHRLGSYDEAIGLFDEFSKRAEKEDPLRVSALEGKGYSLEAKGQLDEAIAAFEQMGRENKTDFLVGMGLYHRARILILQGKKEEAAKAFSELQTAHPKTTASQMATERLAMLASEGVKVPQAPPAAPEGSRDPAGLPLTPKEG
jgi:tetratricopeptide (TPR) repeat protein